MIIKNLPTFILLAVLLVSCSTKLDVAGNVPDGGNIESQLAPGEILLSFPEAGDSVKTEIGTASSGKYPVLWKAGDKIKVNGAESEILSFNSGASAKFTLPKSISTPFNVIYPASALSDDGGKVTIPVYQWYKPNQFDPSAAVLSTSTSSATAAMKFCTAFVKINLSSATRIKIREIKLLALGGEAMSGSFRLNCSTQALSAPSDTRNYVSTRKNEMFELSGTYSFVFAVAPGTYSKGFELIIETTDGQYQVKKAYTSAGVTLTKGKMLNMPSIAVSLTTGSFSGGSGTQSDPYLIATSQDLYNLSQLANSASSTSSLYLNKYYLQISDIDMSDIDGYLPVGNSSAKFTGKYDGNGYLIENLTIDSKAENAGLFGYMGYASGCPSTIVNVTLNKCTIQSDKATLGGMLGYLYYGDVRSCRLVSSTVTGKNSVGGIVGKIWHGWIDGCTTDENTYVNGVSYVGGILGGASANIYDYQMTLRNCVNSAYVNATGNSAGGIVGGGFKLQVSESILIEDCISYGVLTGSAACSGGIIGQVMSESSNYPTGTMLKINRCASYGCVAGSYIIGGIIGRIYFNASTATATIINCCFWNSIYSTANATTSYGEAKYRANVGGIIGYNQMGNGSLSILNSFVRMGRASVVSTPVDGNAAQYSVGGIIGMTSINSGGAGPMLIQGCYTAFPKSGFYIDGSPAASQTNNFGGIYGAFSSSNSSKVSTINTCWYASSSTQCGPGTYPLKENTSAVIGTGTALRDQLNAYVATRTDCLSWVIGTDSYVALSGFSKNESHSESSSINNYGEKTITLD